VLLRAFSDVDVGVGVAVDRIISGRWCGVCACVGCVVVVYVAAIGVCVRAGNGASDGGVVIAAGVVDSCDVDDIIVVVGNVVVDDVDVCVAGVTVGVCIGIGGVGVDGVVVDGCYNAGVFVGGNVGVGIVAGIVDVGVGSVTGDVDVVGCGCGCGFTVVGGVLDSCVSDVCRVRLWCCGWCWCVL